MLPPYCHVHVSPAAACATPCATHAACLAPSSHPKATWKLPNAKQQLEADAKRAVPLPVQGPNGPVAITPTVTAATLKRLNTTTRGGEHTGSRGSEGAMLATSPPTANSALASGGADGGARSPLANGGTSSRGENEGADSPEGAWLRNAAAAAEKRREQRLGKYAASVLHGAQMRNATQLSDEKLHNLAQLFETLQARAGLDTDDPHKILALVTERLSAGDALKELARTRKERVLQLLGELNRLSRSIEDNSTGPAEIVGGSEGARMLERTLDVAERRSSRAEHRLDQLALFVQNASIWASSVRDKLAALFERGHIDMASPHFKGFNVREKLLMPSAVDKNAADKVRAALAWIGTVLECLQEGLRSNGRTPSVPAQASRLGMPVSNSDQSPGTGGVSAMPKPAPVRTRQNSAGSRGAVERSTLRNQARGGNSAAGAEAEPMEWGGGSPKVTPGAGPSGGPGVTRVSTGEGGAVSSNGGTKPNATATVLQSSAILLGSPLSSSRRQSMPAEVWPPPKPAPALSPGVDVWQAIADADLGADANVTEGDALASMEAQFLEMLIKKANLRTMVGDEEEARLPPPPPKSSHKQKKKPKGGAGPGSKDGRSMGGKKGPSSGKYGSSEEKGADADRRSAHTGSKGGDASSQVSSEHLAAASRRTSHSTNQDEEEGDNGSSLSVRDVEHHEVNLKDLKQALLSPLGKKIRKNMNLALAAPEVVGRDHLKARTSEALAKFNPDDTSLVGKHMGNQSKQQ
eukprot:jgi/Mesvir1/4257/Mv22221-RA.2